MQSFFGITVTFVWNISRYFELVRLLQTDSFVYGAHPTFYESHPNLRDQWGFEMYLVGGTNDLDVLVLIIEFDQ